MKANFWWSAGAVLVAAACSGPRAPSQLDDALSAEALGVAISRGAPSLLDRQGDEGFVPRATASGFHRSLGAKQGEVVVAGNTGPQLRLVPLSGPAGFAAWGPGVASGEAVVYPSRDGRSAQVLKATATGVKEDLVLTASLGDALRFGWRLEVGNGLSARLDDDGSVRVVATTGARLVRFTIPAPVVKTNAGDTRAELTHFTLTGEGPYTLELDAHGLDALGYPLSIDPTIVVSTNSELGRAGNLEDQSFIAANAVSRRPPSFGIGTFVDAGTALPTARSGHAAVTSNGFVYVTGGLTQGGSNLDEVLVAPVNSPGTLGPFVTAANRFTSGRYQHASVVYNGTLYVIGGAEWGGSQYLGDLQASRLGPTGQPGPFQRVALLSNADARSNHCAVAANGYLYLAGGQGQTRKSDVLIARINGDGSLGTFTQLTSTLTSPRSGHACVISGDRFYVVGGFDGSTVVNEIVFATINPNNGTLGPFRATTPLPTGRTEHAALVADGALLVLGGLNGSPQRDTFAARINADGSLGRFLAMTSMPNTLQNHAAVSVDDFVYVLGGAAGPPTFDVIAAPLGTNARFTFINNGSTGIEGRYDHASVAYRGNLYVMGGDTAGSPVGTSDIQLAPLLEDGGVGTFVDVTPTPTFGGRRQHSAVAWDGWLYVVGGDRNGNLQMSIEQSPVDVTGAPVGFSLSAAGLPAGRREHTTEAYNGSLYVVGGLTGPTRISELPTSSVLRIPLDGGVVGTPVVTSAMPSARWGHASVMNNGKLYVVGGASSQPLADGGALADVSEVLVSTVLPSGGLSSFSATTPLPGPRRNHTAVASNGLLIVSGGADDTGATQNVTLVAPFLGDGGLGPFTSMASVVGGLAPSRAGHTAFVHNSNLGLVCGSTGAPVGLPRSAEVRHAGIPGAGGRLGPFSTQLPAFGTSRHDHAVVAARDTLYVLGGIGAGPSPLADIQQAPLNLTGTVGLFSPSPTSLPSARQGLAATVVEDRLYVAGGATMTGDLNDVHVAPLTTSGAVGAFVPTSSFTQARSQHAVATWRGHFYVIGGSASGAPRADVQRAAITSGGGLGPFTTLGSSLGIARFGHTALAYDGHLYVVGGLAGGRWLTSIEVAPINADGSLGAFRQSTAMPDGRYEHASVAFGGFLFVVGGSVGFASNEVLVAPFTSNGQLGAFQGTSRFSDPRRGLGVAVWNGVLYVAGGINDASARFNDVQLAGFATPSPVATYSRLFDVGAPASLVSLTTNDSAAARGTLRLEYATAPDGGVFGPVTDVGLITPGAPVALGQTATRFLWAKLTLDESESMVVNADAPLQDVTELSLDFNPNPRLSPPSAMTPPRGSVSFSCSGGSDAGYLFAVATNASMGASISQSGAYQAGPTGSVTDVVRCTDSAGAAELAPIAVGPGISVTPPTASVPPRGPIAFSAVGGDDTFSWSLGPNASGATIDGGTGFYVAGVTGNAADVVRVVDSLGNTAQVSVLVGPEVSIAPPAITLAPGASQPFQADGGDGRYVFSLVSGPSGGSVSDAGFYVAGRTGSTVDAVRVTDSLGNTATATVTVTPGVSLSPAMVTVPPRGTQTFTASGGSNTTYLWSMAANPSDGGVSGAGVYSAGATGSVTDVVQARDPLGNLGTASVTVGPGISVTPASPSTVPRGSITFAASGGSGLGFMYGLVVNQSGASVTDAGLYTAGPGPMTDGGIILVTDTLRVFDSLGNTLDFTVEVTNGLAITPRMISVPPRTVVDVSATGGSAPYTWAARSNRSGGTLDAGTTSAQFMVGTTGSVVDELEVRDSLGEVRVSTITVTAAIGITPAMRAVVPREAVSFSAAGGSAMGWVWSLATNASGGSISPTTGAYLAGNTGNVTDVVQVTDSLGNLATANVTVGPAITIMPAMAEVPPRGMQAFNAMGGAGANFTWTLVNRSGGNIDGFTGQYTAGATGGVVDVVQVRDPLGNTASANVVVTGSLALMPRSPSVAPNGALSFTAQGGVPPLRWELSPNRSGGTLDMMGGYRAGATPSVTDTVQVTDSLGSSVSTDVAVGVGVSISPSNPTVGAGGAVSFTASGGSGAGFTWAITTNTSGATVLDDGTYTAGPTPGLDTVQVTDGLGNTATTSVSVIEGGVVNQVPFAQRPPVSGWSCGCNVGGDAFGGLLALGLLLLRARRRRLAPLLALVLVAALPSLAAPASAKKKKPAVSGPAKPVEPPPAPVVQPEPPPAPVVAPPPGDGKPSAAVLDVDVTIPGEKLDAAAFSEMLVNSVDGTGMFRVISSKEIVTLIGLERQRQLLGCSEDSSCMAEIANALGSELVVSAAVGKVGSTYLVSVRLIDGRTSRTAARANAEVTDPNMLLRAVWTASQEMLDKYGASLPPDQAAKWANRPKQAAPAQLASIDTTPNFFGVSAGVVGGVQVLSEAGKRGSIGAQVDLTFQRGRLDLAAGLIIGPNLGVRLTATWALIASRFRLGVGLRGAGYPGLRLYGGGVVTTAEFTIVSVWSVFAAGGAELSPAAGAPVLVLLGTLGTGVRF